MANNTTIKAAAVALIGIAAVSMLMVSNDAEEDSQIAVDQASETGSQLNRDTDQHRSAEQDSEFSEPAEIVVENRVHVEDNIAYLSVEEYAERSQYGELPAHMKNIALLSLFFDKDGNFTASVNLKNLIDHFLLSAEVEGREQSLARIREYLEMVLPESAAGQALQIMEQYLAYEARVAEDISVDSNEPDINTLANQIEQMVQKKKAIRREIMSADIVEALFGEEELLDDFNVTTMRLNLDKSLSYEEKDRRTAEAERLLPERLQEKKRYQRERKNLDREIAALKKQTGKDAEIYEKRKAFYGKETADRMTYYDDASPEWLARVEQFNQDKAAILRQSGLSESEYQQQIITLKTGMFSEKEQLKLAVYNIRKAAGEVP